MELISYFFLLSGISLVLYSIISIFRNNFNSFNISILGFGFLSFLDVPKYFFFVKETRGGFPDDIYYVTVLVIFLSLVIFLISWRLTSRSKQFRRKLNYKYRDKSTVNAFYIIPLSVAIYFAPVGGSFSTLVNFFVFGILLSAFSMFLGKGQTKYAFISMVILLLLVIFDPYTSRRAYIAIMFPILFILSSYFMYIGNNRYIKFQFLLFTLSIFIFLFLNVLRSDHDFGAGYVEGDYISNTISYIITMRSVDTFWNTLYVVYNFPVNFSYYWGETYISILVALIPREIWPSKPVGFSALLGIMQRTGSQQSFDPVLWQSINYFSLSPGMIGEAVANFGLFGCLFLPLILGYFAKRTENILEAGHLSTRATARCCLLSFFFIVHRGDMYSAIMFPLFLYLGFSIANFLFIGKKPNIP